MTFPDEQLAELTALCDSAEIATEGEFTYIRLSKLRLPPGFSPPVVDALLCPMERNNYHSRLFVSERVTAPSLPADGKPVNWTDKPRILEENWEQFSFQLGKCNDLRLAQMVMAHVWGLGRCA